MNIKEHNYSAIAQKTKIVFQLFARRSLAKQIIDVLQKNKTKKQAMVSQSQIALEIQQYSNEPLNDKKYFQQNDSHLRNTVHLNKTGMITKEQKIIKINELRYGDYVTIEMQSRGEIFRIITSLEGLKLIPVKELNANTFNLKRAAFQLANPSPNFQENNQPISQVSMICLKNALTSKYIHFTDKNAKTKEFGYGIKLLTQIGKQGLFVLNSFREQQNPLTTSEDISIGLYYNPLLKLSVSEEKLMGRTDRSLLASYSSALFRLSKVQNASSLAPNPFYYIRFSQLGKNLQIEEPTIQRFTQKRQIRQFYIDQNQPQQQQTNQGQLQDCKCKIQFYELMPMRQSANIRLGAVSAEGACQVWEVERIDELAEGWQCRIRSAVTNQQIANDGKDVQDSLTNFKRNSFLQLRKNGSQFILQNDQSNSLTALYDRQYDRYQVKYEHESAFSGEGSANKNNSCKIQLIQISQAHTSILYKLLELNDILKQNYEFIQKWGFDNEDRSDRIKLSLGDLKKDARLVKMKIEEVNIVLLELNKILEREDHTTLVQTTAKQLKMLDLLIMYCQVIKIKMSKSTEANQRNIFKFTGRHLQSTLLSLFDTIFLFTRHNKSCSQVIIENNLIFNSLLQDYCRPIGRIIQQAIKNLCILTNKIIEQQDVIFSWTTHIQQISDPQLLEIQTTYIQIISQVAVDPNDIGIHPYQYKIKEQIIGNRKKKIFPKFIVAHDKLTNTFYPSVVFQYAFFPKELTGNQNSLETTSKSQSLPLQLRQLFTGRSQIASYTAQIEYISSILKLMRNLCKDRNKKLAKVMEDYGLTVQFMHYVFRSTEISWEIITKFLDLYCVMYLIQDPFLSFEKRETKCFAWHKIDSFDFSLKTGMLFNQFTEQHSATEKIKSFDFNILPVFDQYFEDMQKLPEKQWQQQGRESFNNIVGILYQVINFGYLNQQSIQKYTHYILLFSQRNLRFENRREKKIQLVNKIVKILSISQEIWTIIYSMNLLLILYKNLKESRETSLSFLKKLMKKTLEYDTSQLQIYQQKGQPKKRRQSINIRSTSNREQHVLPPKISTIDHSKLDDLVIQFSIGKLLQTQLGNASNSDLKSLLCLLEMVSKRGERICTFLGEVFILNSQEEENIYHQYSGIAPIGVQNESVVSRRLLNVMKMKELVDKIMEDSVELQEQGRKKQKVAQLSSLLSKVTKNLQALRCSNNQLFKVSQIIIRKLGFHQILIEVLKRWERQSYQVLINTIVSFFLEFVRDNQKNSEELAKYFQIFTRKYSFERLPQLLSILFSKNGSREEDFWLVYKNIDQKIDNSQKQILFQSIYNLLKTCPQGRLKKVKGHVIYNLITNSKFQDYIKGTIQSPNFINIVCCMGWKSSNLQQRIKDCISKTGLFNTLASKSNNFILKAMTLKIYHFLYLSRGEMDETECEQLVEKVFLEQIKHLPSSCHARASTRIQQLKSSLNNQMQQGSSIKIESIITEYSSLMMEGNDQVSTSEQENYFLYLLNIKDQNQLSLLSCLQEVLVKYSIAVIDPIANYIFKLISFMERIFMKEEKVYQSRILNKLYEISTVIQERYNRSPKIEVYFSFEVAYKKAQIFFKHFAQIIQQQNLGFSKILKSARISYKQIQKYRNDIKVQKLILQSQFLSFIKDICSVINDRNNFDLLISQATIKQFFILYSEKGTHKMNMIKFMAKLMEILEHQKAVKLYNHIMQSRKNDQQRQSRNDDRNQASVMNYELLMGEISSIQQTYNSHLWESIPNKIKLKIQYLLPFHQQHYKRIKIYDIIATHLNNSEFSIMPLFVFQIINQSQVHISDLEFKDQKMVGEYLEMLSLEIDKKVKGAYSLQIISSFYEAFRQSSKQRNLFYINIEKISNNSLRNLVEDRIQFNSRVCYNYAKLYNILSQSLKCDDFPSQNKQSLQLIILKALKDCFCLYCESQSNYWIHHSIAVLEIVLGSFTKYDSLSRIAKNIAEDTQFTNKIRLLIVKTMEKGMRSTNIQSQLSVKMINNLFRLFKKLRAHNFEAELEKILTKFPLKRMFNCFQQNYHYFNQQQRKTALCEMQTQCSLQYCNEGKKSVYDGYISQVYLNLLLMVNVAIEIISENPAILKLMPQEQKIFILGQDKQLSQVVYNQNGQSTTKAPFMRSIQVTLSGQDQIFNFHTATEQSSRDFLIKKQIQSGLKHIDGSNYYASLYNLSIYVQQLQQCVRLINKGYIYKHILHNFSVYQVFVMIFLLSLCLSLAFSFQIPPAAILAFNTLCLSTKIFGFSFQMKLFYYLFFVLKDIKYNRSLIIEKSTSILLSLIAIMCYSAQYSVRQIYPFTLLIEILKLRITKELILLLWTGISEMTFSILVMMVMIICSTFIVFDKIQDKNGNQSLFNVFMGTFKQTQLYQFLPVNPSDQNDYKYITMIPQVLPIMNFLNLYIISVVIAIMLKKLNTDRQFLEDSQTKCGVCGLRKQNFEKKGLSFSKHIQTVHNYWNYIDFFIYLRRKVDKEREQLEFIQLIESKDFRFLRT